MMMIIYAEPRERLRAADEPRCQRCGTRIQTRAAERCATCDSWTPDLEPAEGTRP
jgi:lipopolysaccharide biosynthesis regulator YciM